jgi:hypothetical protein
MNRPILTADEWHAMHVASARLEQDAHQRTRALRERAYWAERCAKQSPEPTPTA